MKYSIQFFLMFLIALFATTQLASIAAAQDDDGGIRILINGKEFEINEKQIEKFFEDSGEEIEQWAERHALSLIHI